MTKFGSGYQLKFHCSPGKVGDVERFVQTNIRSVRHLETYAGNDDLSTVDVVIELILSVVLNLILQLTSLYTDLMEILFMNLSLVVMSLSVVYPVIVLILLPTSSLFIYSVSYISLY